MNSFEEILKYTKAEEDNDTTLNVKIFKENVKKWCKN